MKADIAFSGLVGLVVGLFIFLFSNWIKYYIPSLVSNLFGTLLVFSALILIALAEMPVMLFGMRRMSQSASSPRSIVTGTFMLYVVFASIYAAIFEFVTGDNYYSLGTILAGLSVVRFASGLSIK